MKQRQTRLDKLLVDRGLGARKDIKGFIKCGRIQVDGTPIFKTNEQIPVHASVTFDGVLVPPLPMLLAWHKPIDMQSTYRDPWGRRGLDEVLPVNWRRHFHPVGRLDAETSGLLLFARVGRLTQWLLHPKREVERSYVAQVEGALAHDAINTLETGVKTAEGTFKAQVLSTDGPQIALVVREGRHRMVRRMLANVGHPVVKLHRVRYGPVSLRDLPPEEFRPASKDEVQALQVAGAPIEVL